MYDNYESSFIGSIDPSHLLLALKNSMEHRSETTHGVTGLTFKHYSITVRKRHGPSWVVELRFKTKDPDQNHKQEANARSRCRRSSRRR